MSDHHHHVDPETSEREIPSLITSAEWSQRNIRWEDTFRNQRPVIETLWHGSNNLPMVQKIGLVVIGLAYLSTAIGLAAIGGWLSIPVIAIMGYVAFRLIRNGLRKSKHGSKRLNDDHDG